MMSERKFANSFSSFWNELLPTADTFVRRMNLSLDRYCRPIEAILQTDRDRRSLINELSFRLFMEFSKGEILSFNEKKDLSIKVSKYIEKLSPNINLNQQITEAELGEAESLSSSLTNYFPKNQITALKFWPLFKGCGRINACKGDILCNDKLIEVKAGDRHFRITDIRQLITYLSLNSISKQYEIKRVGLVNPRKGLSFETTVDILIEDCSRKKPVDVFGDVIDFISSEIISN